ncbi:MAG: hypothetical protein CMJ18_11270 [Phycisphaeraceae bacterium]|nr:hypothetical protein [Phycisphaeraceae bacterium]
MVKKATLLGLVLAMAAGSTAFADIILIDPRVPANQSIVINPQSFGTPTMTVNELVGLDPAHLGDTGADWVTNDVIFEATQDWTLLGLRIELTQGTIYQTGPPFGGDAPQPAFWPVPGFQHLEADTWLADGSGLGVDSSQPSFDAFPPPDQSTTRQFDSSRIDVLTFTSGTEDTGTLHLARITLSADAEGEAWIAARDAGSAAHDPNRVEICPTCPDGRILIQGGQFTPEPGSLVLLALGGLAGLARRR